MNVSTVSIKKNGRSSFTGSNLSLRHNNKNHLKSKEFLAGINHELFHIVKLFLFLFLNYLKKKKKKKKKIHLNAFFFFFIKKF